MEGIQKQNAEEYIWTN